MLIRYPNLQTSVIVLLSVIALFFFPAPRGSFVSTHGPMTTLRLRTEAALLKLGSVVRSVHRRFAAALAATGDWLPPAASESPGSLALLGFCVLRI
jgi:hypothetical protein